MRVPENAGWKELFALLNVPSPFPLNPNYPMSSELLLALLKEIVARLPEPPDHR